MLDQLHHKMPAILQAQHIRSWRLIVSRQASSTESSAASQPCSEMQQAAGAVVGSLIHMPHQIRFNVHLRAAVVNLMRTPPERRDA